MSSSPGWASADPSIPTEGEPSRKECGDAPLQALAAPLLPKTVTHTPKTVRRWSHRGAHRSQLKPTYCPALGLASPRLGGYEAGLAQCWQALGRGHKRLLLGHPNAGRRGLQTCTCHSMALCLVLHTLSGSRTPSSGWRASGNWSSLWTQPALASGPPSTVFMGSWDLQPSVRHAVVTGCRGRQAGILGVAAQNCPKSRR